MDLPDCWRALLFHCCGSGSGGESIPCAELAFSTDGGLSNRPLCVMLSGCSPLDDYPITVAQLSAACHRWFGFISPGKPCANAETGCIFDIVVNVICGTGIDAECAQPGEAESYVEVFGNISNCPDIPSATYELVDEPGGSSTRLPITWINADPPIGIARGYMKFTGDPPADECLCADDTLVEILITREAC